MATKISDIPGIERQIGSLEEQKSVFQERLGDSPTALGGEGQPTAFDIENQESLQRINKEIQSLTDTRLRTKWYGTDATPSAVGRGETEEPVSPGVLGSVLDFISRPLYGVVGATKHFIGQGSDSLQQDIADNILRNKSTFGDVLKTTGVPWAVSAPLGFALDVGLDPVNWLTVGTGALVPRLGAGVYKGIKAGEVVGGISAAAKSGVLEKAATVGRYTPFFRKTEMFGKLGSKTLKATDAWEAISGHTAANLVTQRGFGVGAYRVGLGNLINSIADATPGGQSMLQHFVYDPIEWVRQAGIKDIFQESLGPGVDIRKVVNARLEGKDITELLSVTEAQTGESMRSVGRRGQTFTIDLDPSIGAMTSKEVDKASAALAGAGLESKVVSIAPKIVNSIDDAEEILKNPVPYISADPIENALRLVNERVGGSAITFEDISAIVNSGALDETGVRWFDSMMRSARDFKLSIGRNSNKVVAVGQKVMDTYNQAMSIFRAGKVGASPSAYVNAVVGNAVMAHMATGGISKRLMVRLKQSFDMYRNKTGAAALLDDLLMNAGKEMGDADYIRRALGENRTAARGTFGSLDFVNANYNAERVLQAARDAGVVSSSMKAEDIASDVKQAMDELAQVRVEAGTEPIRNLLRSSGGNITRLDVGTGQLANEMFNTRAATRMFDHIAEKAKSDSSNVAWKLLDFTFNKMPSKYETIDQTWKLATFLNATVDGYSLAELRNIRNFIDINPEELRRVAEETLVKGKKVKTGRYLYRLSPKSALELSNVIYLNYNAMPAAVRVLRNFPLLGSPFVSFMYGMVLKTGQTLAYNPSAFNKVNFAMKDFGGRKTPFEKKALEQKFYSYLKEPGMFRAPFFDANPIYMNLSSMIPYYSLNMINPSQTNYGDSLPEKLAQSVQSSPILKDPAGSVIFDYFIQPLILGEAIRPQGQFGQPLYPVDATGGEKLGYALRSTAESFVPTISSYAGLVTPEGMADYVPSYRWRQLARAKEGKNPLGISGKEDAISRSIRSILQTTGIPVQTPVNLSFGQSQR